MTETEWFACFNPDSLLYFLQDSPSDRKLRLFAVACCRRIWGVMTDERSRHLVVVSERHADGDATDLEWQEASAEAAAAFAQSSRLTAPELYGDPTCLVVPEQRVAAHAGHAATCAAWSLGQGVVNAIPGHWGRAMGHTVATEAARAVHADYPTSPERPAQCDLLRDIVGNPFQHRPPLDPAWLTSAGRVVVTIAAAAYEERMLPVGTLDPERLGVLADALEDAGCSDIAILDHLRSPGPHVRGCWPLDLILGKR